MFDRLITVLLDIWSSLIPWTVNDAYEGGVVLRFGKYHRPAPPGLIFHFPFNIERVITCNIVVQTTTIVTLPQTLKDGTLVACRVILKWQVADAQKYLLEIEGGESFMVEAAGPLVCRALKSATWEEAMNPDFADNVTKLVRRKAWKWGCEILSVDFMTLTPLGLKTGHLFISNHN